nr:MAG TPA: hypothetical protein [Caudoviricetes sp.]
MSVRTHRAFPFSKAEIVALETPDFLDSSSWVIPIFSRHSRNLLSIFHHLQVLSCP